MSFYPVALKLTCALGLAVGCLANPGTVLAAPAGTESAPTNEILLATEHSAAALWLEADGDPAVRRAAGDLAEDIQRVTGSRPALVDHPEGTVALIIGTLGESPVVDRLVAAGKLEVAGVRGEWESYAVQVVVAPCPGVPAALVIAGSDRRGTIYGIYHLSELIGVSPWYWWADVPVTHHPRLALRGIHVKQGPPAVKFRGIFLNDEDWGLRPWAAKTLEPETGNIGPKTYAKVFELLLRLHANYLWPAMHPGTTAFNMLATNRELAQAYGIVMGSSHCEQMLRDNVSEWDEAVFGKYDFVTNPAGVLKYWEQRVRENGKFENVYTVGMRGIHDGGIPGGGTEREKAARLQTIIADQRDLLARLVNTNVAKVPQIFCPYKEVLPLYRLMKQLPEDITLVWPDDNYGYIRQFSNERERARSGGAGVYYHVSYWGAPRDYLWLCTTPPALMAEEMTKAYAYGADRVWMLNVGDLKPAELDLEFFLKLAWQPGAWTGTNTYELLGRQLARDFGPGAAGELTSILAEYYRLNFQRKPEHLMFPTNDLFTADEAAQRLADWQALTVRVGAVEPTLPAAARDAFFELVGYPVLAAAAMNQKCLAGSPAAAADILRLTADYNERLAGGKWRNMMSANPRGQVGAGVPPPRVTIHREVCPVPARARMAGADFVEDHQRVVLAAAHASELMPGKDAHWQLITGLGYGGTAMTVFPVTAATRSTPETIRAESPCLHYRIYLETPGDWKITVRSLPTFSVVAGQPQRYAIALDDAPPKIVALPGAVRETDRTWRENVLRNAALTESVHPVARAGLHTLKIWMVDPGLVLDGILAETGGAQAPGYVWPAETK